MWYRIARWALRVLFYGSVLVLALGIASLVKFSRVAGSSEDVAIVVYGAFGLIGLTAGLVGTTIGGLGLLAIKEATARRETASPNGGSQTS